ncbi:hypothetical protein V8E53_000012 [Lactarius tabidus]
MPSDPHNGDVSDTTVPQGGSQWGSGRPDPSQPAVNADSDDRQRELQQRAPTNYIPATAYTSRGPYPAKAQSHCSGPYPYPSQPYNSTVNYVQPPYDFAEYLMHPVNAHHGGQYSFYVTHPQYPPYDLIMSFHSPDYAGNFTDGPLCSALSGQHQHSLLPISSSYWPYDDCLGHYEHYAQPPAPPFLTSPSSSELGHALVETPLPESQPINRDSITLPSISMSSPSIPKHELSEILAGLNAVKTEYDAPVNGQPFSPITSLSILSTELVPHLKEERQDHVHGFSSAGMPYGRPHHRQHTHDSFRLVADPAAYRGYTSPPPSKRPLPLAIPDSLAYSPSTLMHTPLSSAFSSSDIGTPASSIRLVDSTGVGSSSQAPAPAPSLAPNLKAGQGVLKLPSTKRSARRKPAIACLFCRERKIACGAPQGGSADPTCNQCARRSRKCEYPTMSRRGLHKRRDNSGSHPKESEDGTLVPFKPPTFDLRGQNTRVSAIKVTP